MAGGQQRVILDPVIHDRWKRRVISSRDQA